MNYLVYFCIFGNKDYLNLVHLLAVSIKLFGVPNENIDFLAVTNNNFTDDLNNIFNKLSLNFNIYLIDNNNFEYNLSSRLIIFNYENINNYNKILYIDTDILITNNLNNLFNETLEDKLYVLSEGIISDMYHGFEFFNFRKINKSTKGFTSGILILSGSQLFKKSNPGIPKIISPSTINIFKHPPPGLSPFFDHPFKMFGIILNHGSTSYLGSNLASL